MRWQRRKKRRANLEDREQFRVVKLEALRTEIRKGTDSGAGIPAQTVFAELRTRIRKVAAGQSGKS